MLTRVLRTKTSSKKKNWKEERINRSEIIISELLPPLMILPSLCRCYCCYPCHPCCWWRISWWWWWWWSGNVRYARGSHGLLWSGRTFHSGGIKTQASRRLRALLRSVSGGTGSPSDWKSGLNNPVYVELLLCACVCLEEKENRERKRTLSTKLNKTNTVGVHLIGQYHWNGSIFWSFNKSALPSLSVRTSHDISLYFAAPSHLLSALWCE